MSATVTENPVTSTIQQDYLHDYQIRLTGGVEEAFARGNEDAPAPAAEYPPGWNMDLADRPWGSNGVESAFVYLMLNGCWLQGVTNWLWRTTGGRVNKDYFRFKVGGEI
ncbi:uncharacterized protein ColSpa_10460 [Colletotrichum spaethianum]|uniref:Uncharacterized protein n=1 Tax=Colletotrichum spaethianum TaxID=700344 RepID=A0AA37UJT7_9PEZI|nr:uncharacterized protein ColSpa_10460 [Colletotrichum spaethianum]GKT50279.1 hypothetical protein ColSpa_10460 [Colletotrichum spaethianum]